MLRYFGISSPSILPEQLVKPEELDNIFMYLDAVGIQVYNDSSIKKEKEKPAELLSKTKATTKYKSDIRIDDPIRIYLKDMGKVFLLSREGEVSIAKKIENGRIRIIKNLFYIPLGLREIVSYYDKLKNNNIRIEEFIHVDVNDWPHNYSGWKEKQRVMRLLEGIEKYRKKYCESLKRLKKLKYMKKILEEQNALQTLHEKIISKVARLKIQEKVIFDIVYKLKEIVSEVRSIERKVKKNENYFGMERDKILELGEKRITKKLIERVGKNKEQIKQAVEDLQYLVKKLNEIEKNEILLLR
ncbi:unnamed protein product, partial [marine sediment metagenome]